MDIVISIVVALVIGILPLKKLFAFYFFSYEDLYMKHYDLKKCYDIWGHISYILPLLDFLKGPMLYYVLKILNIQASPLVAIILIVLWKVNPLKDFFLGRGMSFFMGISLIINIEIFRLVILIYLSLLILSRYQSIASFLTGILATPVVFLNTSFTLIELTVVIICSGLVLISYKSSFYQIFNKRFFHLSQ
ncbi:MAG: hypothetical protein APF76_03900 [Desulfitibacter sp. BRH_c19]|nr:MAG: hypothetical protein APF76_03900 [Desulfitibacter sp. BRH_c19]